MTLLRRNEWRPEYISARLRVPEWVGRHELGRREHDLPIPLQRAAIAASSPNELAQIDRVRLLPDEEHADPRRTVATIRPHHLRPPRPLIALARRVRSRHR